MKITVLMENTCGLQHKNLKIEHGLSLYIETENHKILFDTGQTDAFAKNAETLNRDLNQIDVAVLSHGHYDHGGGIRRFLELNSRAPVYMSCHAFEPHYSGLVKSIGLDLELQNERQIVLTGDAKSYPQDDVTVIDEELELYSCNAYEKRFEMNPYGLYRVENGEKVPEDFRHEQYLLIKEKGKRILISGCSHKGILNIVDWFRPDILIGGFHFTKLDPDGEGQAALEEAAKVLKQYPTVYYTGHCTGQSQFAFLKERMGEQLHYLAAGDTIIV